MRENRQHIELRLCGTHGPKFSLKHAHETNSLARGLKDEDSQPFVDTSDTGFSENSAPLEIQ
jgi:hypothetical protein